MTRTTSTLLALVLVGCGGDDTGAVSGGTSSPTGGIDPSTTGGEDSSSGAVGGSGDGSTGAATTGADGDPHYPRPEPVAEDGSCPPGSFGPITFDGGGWVCLPECTNAAEICPEPESGDAVAECATNPFSSAEPCADSSDCTIADEMCGNAGGGQMACLLPPSHCILRCDEGQTCPDDMTCAAGPGICQYEP